MSEPDQIDQMSEKDVREQLRSLVSLVHEMEKEKKRTGLQNNSLHLWLSQVATILNDAGIDMVLLLDKLNGKAEIPCTTISLKKRFWKPIQEHMTGKESTTDISTKEPDLIYKTACKVLSENFGIVPPPWPSRFNHGE